MGIEDSRKGNERGGLLRKIADKTGVREAALAAGLLASEPSVMENLGHTAKVEAAEIAADASWQTGIQEFFRVAHDEPNEVEASFLQTSDGNKIWITPPITGFATGLSVKDFADQLGRTNLKDAAKSITASRPGEPITVCEAHTHNLNSMKVLREELQDKRDLLALFKSFENIDLQKRVSMPPSRLDITQLTSFTANYVESHSLAKVNMINIVVDPVFLMYYQQFPSDDHRSIAEWTLKTPEQDQRRTIMAAQANWFRYVNISQEPEKELLNSQEYAKLRYTYAVAGIDLRLVPREDVAKEPDCAGASYSGTFPK